MNLIKQNLLNELGDLVTEEELLNLLKRVKRNQREQSKRKAASNKTTTHKYLSWNTPKKVYNITKDIIYNSVSEAARDLDCNRNLIICVCNKKYKHAKNNILEWLCEKN